MQQYCQMENLRKELEIKLDKIYSIYIFAQEIYVYTEYFHKPKTKEEIELITESIHSSNFRFLMHVMFRSLINEVAKLFSNSENDKYRLGSFIDSFSQTGYFRKIGIPSKRINVWKQYLIDNIDSIEKIRLLRNKIYAHTDDPSKSYNNIDISFKEIENLLQVAKSIINEIAIAIFDKEFDTRPFSFDRDRFILLELLVKAEKQRKEDILQNALERINMYKDLC